jgi:hypothetical protein
VVCGGAAGDVLQPEPAAAHLHVGSLDELLQAGQLRLAQHKVVVGQPLLLDLRQGSTKL